MAAQDNEEKKVYLPEPLSYFGEALSDEINEIEKNGQTTTILKNGRSVRTEKENYWYAFDVQYMPELPPETPGKLRVGRERYNVCTTG